MKAAVTSLGWTLAVELGPDAFRVNTIAPDLVPTPNLFRHLPPDLANENDEARALSDSIAIPMGRRGDYGDVGGCVLFLASDLSRYLTGVSLHPDGGALAAKGWFNWPQAGWRQAPPKSVVVGYLQQLDAER